MLILTLILSLLAGYLLGSLNISIIIGKLKGDDIRNHGSGNAGATNSLRVYGKKIAALVLLGDALKAVVAVFVGLLIAKLSGLDAETIMFCKFLAGFGAVLGHNFPLYFGFKGGKGIITSVAFIFTVDPLAGSIILVSGVIIIAITRYVSLGSVVGAILYPICVIVSNIGKQSATKPYYIALSVVLALLAVYRHKANIKRLIAGNESKLGQKK
ncbi:MAG: glycerol-3-phosphate 1-O-acyltransferase PlsY [Clostridia bacterium]|nr:glycerol-3-phosphate 1-O-acyltransferase PlsY [Clostridia bacterium]